MPDISAIVTAHSEAFLAGPTMRSAEAAASLAEQNGLSVEKVVVLDSATDECRRFFQQPAFGDWRVEEVAFRDQGKTRNHAARQAKGKWIAFLDADDLWSENWLLEAARLLAGSDDRSGRVIVHPELNWIFDRVASVLVKIPQDDPQFSPYYWYFGNYYDALCMCPKEAHTDFPYADRDLPAGFAFEDWQWNMETMAAGWRHVVARDTIIFKRRREASQTIRASQNVSTIRNVEALSIDLLPTLHRHAAENAR